MEYRFFKKNPKVAMFDLDGTIIKTKSGKTFPIDKNDFMFLYPEVPKKLKELYEKGYKIVVFSNQKGISTGKTKLEDIVSKIDKTLGKDTEYFISTKNDIYRKPFPTMFVEFMKMNGPIEKTFYVGDAAGRKGDFSDSDINFAHNIHVETNTDITFYTPEEFFLNKKESVKPVCPIFPEKGCNIPRPSSFGKNMVVIMTGYPGSGKSTFVKNIQENRDDTTIISNDIQGVKKSDDLYKMLIKEKGHLIFVDNLNTTKKSREKYIKLAKENKYKVIGIHVITSIDLSKFMNQYRFYKSQKDLVPDIVYNTYRKNFEPLEISEGFNLVFELLPKFEKINYCF